MKAEILSTSRRAGLVRETSDTSEGLCHAPTLCRLPRLFECGCLHERQRMSSPERRSLQHFLLLIICPKPARLAVCRACTHLDKCPRSCHCRSCAQACIARLYGCQEPYDCQPFTPPNVASPCCLAPPWRSAWPFVLQPGGHPVSQNPPSAAGRALLASQEAEAFRERLCARSPRRHMQSARSCSQRCPVGLYTAREAIVHHLSSACIACLRCIPWYTDQHP